MATRGVESASRGPSLAGRAIEAIVLLVGFYLLVAVVALLMIAAPVLEWMYADRLHFYLLALAFGGLALLWSLVPRREQWVDPGIAFDSTSEPELWAAIAKTAERVGQPMPASAYLIDDVNAFVASRGTFLGLGRRRVIGVGVPLMALLDERELESVLAHEFGHFYGGDTKLGPVVYATHNAIGRSLDAASTGWSHWLFATYANFYLRRTQAVSRAQELAADRLAARLTSPETTAAALARVRVGSAAFEYYCAEEYAPVLEAGRRPPYLDGFKRALGSTAVREHAATDTALGRDAHSPFDSHPPTAERIRALGIDPALVTRAPRFDGASLRLLRDPAAVEAALVRRHLIVLPESLPLIGWDQIADDVLVPRWRTELQQVLLPAAPDLRPGELPTDDPGLAALGKSIYQAHDDTANRYDRIALARVQGSLLLMLAAIEAGWQPVMGIGEALEFRRDGATLPVADDWSRVLSGSLEATEWRAQLAAASISASVREVTDPALAETN